MRLVLPPARSPDATVPSFVTGHFVLSRESPHTPFDSPWPSVIEKP